MCNFLEKQIKLKKCLNFKGRDLVINDKCDCYKCIHKEICNIPNLLKYNFKKGDKDV